jgi:hypothetical protein
MRWVLALGLLSLCACSQQIVARAEDSRVSAGGDARERGDVGVLQGDGAAPDLGAPDAATADAAPLDGSPLDGSPQDATSVEVPDAGQTCHVDRFSSCPDPDEATRANNTPSDSFYRDTGGVGCQMADVFTPGSTQVSSKICHNEPADWYEVTLVPCRTLTLQVTVQLTVHTPCEPTAFELRVNGHPCDGSDPNVSCMRAGNVQTIQYIVRPSNSVGSLDLGVVRLDDAVAADYTLTYNLER